MSDTLVKSDLVNCVYDCLGGFSKTDCRDILENMLLKIEYLLKRDGFVNIRGFGSFILQKRKGRVCYDMHRNKKSVLPDRYVVIFRPSSNIIR